MTTDEANTEILSLLAFWGDANGLPKSQMKNQIPQIPQIPAGAKNVGDKIVASKNNN